jgi:hypothetical protein
MRTGKVTARTFLGVKLDEGAALYHQLTKRLVLRVRTVTPMNALRLAEFGHLLDPGENLLVCSWRVVCRACHMVRHLSQIKSKQIARSMTV